MRLALGLACSLTWVACSEPSTVTPAPAEMAPVVPVVDAAPLVRAPRLVQEDELAPPHAASSFGERLAFDGRRLASGQSALATLGPDGEWTFASVRALFDNGPWIGPLAFTGDELAFCRTWASNNHVGELLIGSLHKRKLARFAGTRTDFTCTAMVADRDRVAVGAAGSLTTRSVGQVRLYARDPRGVWKKTVTILPPKRVKDDAQFGYALALDGDTLVVGAQTSRVEGAFIYRLADGKAELVQALEDQGVHLFGTSVAVSGAWLAVGSYRAPTRLYRLRDGRWHEAQAIDDPAGPGESTFGNDLALYGDLLVIGDAGRGAAHVYWREPDGVWRPIAKLDAEDRGISHIGMAITDTHVAIGLPRSIWSKLHEHGSIRIFRIER
jgi:hypothetical protein